MPRRLTGVKEYLKSWPLIGRANFISTNDLSFALGSQPFEISLRKEVIIAFPGERPASGGHDLWEEEI